MTGHLSRLLLALPLALIACSSPTAPSSVVESGGGPTGGGSSVSGTVAALGSLTNDQRIAAGLPALRLDSALSHAAQLHADQMVVAGRLAHVLDEGPYPSPPDRLAAAGYRWRAWGENIAFGQRTAADAVTAWMDSPGHRANILNANFTELGVAHAVTPAGRSYYVQMFGRPAP